MPHLAKSSCDSAIQSLVIMARLHDRSVNEQQISHRYSAAGKLSLTELLRAAQELGFKVRHRKANWEQLTRLPLPAMILGKDGCYRVIAKVSDQSALVQEPFERAPQKLPRKAFEDMWSGEVILFRDVQGSEENTNRFGVSWFIPAFKKYRGLFAEVLIASLFIQVFALLTPLIFQVIIDKVLVHRGLSTLDVLAIGLFMIVLFEVLLSGIRSYILSHTTNRIDVELGSRLFRHLVALPLSYFKVRKIGEGVARVRELENIRQFMTGAAMMSLLDVLFIGVFLAVMFYYSPILAWVVVGSIPVYMLIALVAAPVLRKYLVEKFQQGARNQALVVETLSGIETIKSLSAEPRVWHRWERQLARYVSTGFKADFMANLSGHASQFVNKLVIIALLWLGARQVLDGQLTIGGLVAFNMLAMRVSQPMLRLMTLWQEFQQAGISIERLGDILNTPVETTNSSMRGRLSTVSGHIAFRQVSFRYRPETMDVLSRLELEVQPGEVIGLVGGSGSGKSTMARLLQNLYRPHEGQVLIDDLDVRQFDLAWLRQQVGVLSQEHFLIHGSVYENIAFARPSASLDEVVESAKLAAAHDFIVQLPEGYEELVGEQGAKLSGGQKQRIALARLLLTNPRVLILDEATSALDYLSESVILNNLEKICRGRTVLIIAHRLNMVQRCDRILVLEQGRIIEEGNHQDLLERGGRYAEMHDSQLDVMVADDFDKVRFSNG